MELNSFWAKSNPFQSVVTHAVVSGHVAGIVLDGMVSDGTEEQLERITGLDRKELYSFTEYLVSLHDIGKLTAAFQAKDPAMLQRLKTEKLDQGAYSKLLSRHEAASAKIMMDIWTNDMGWDRRTARLCAGILGAHHQGKANQIPALLDDWGKYHRLLEAKMRTEFSINGEIKPPAVDKAEKGAFGAIMLGITVLSDWIASSEAFADAEDWIQQEGWKEKLESEVCTFLSVSGLQKTEHSYGEKFTDVWQNFSEDSLRPLQKSVEQLFIENPEKMSAILIEAPMGEGKTEAGCYAASQMMMRSGKYGIYFALPTSATANQMVGRMRAWMQDHVRLLHSMAWLVDEGTAEKSPNIADSDTAQLAQAWSQPVRRGLLSPYAVGTIDQALMAAMMIKYGVLRLFGLSGKVLLIDELHAYDVYMSQILQRLLEWCKALEIPVVMLSATLPPEKKQQMLKPFTNETPGTDYPVISAVTESGKLIEKTVPKVSRSQTFNIKLLPILHKPEEIAAEAVELTADGGCGCILVNTVKQAQDVYRALEKTDFEGQLLLFHARFPAERRNEIEQQCIRLFGKDKSNRPEKALLVATQVVEQSLDVDFDFMMTAVAPIDLLLQRTGRVYRHANSPRPAGMTGPVIYMMIPDDKELPDESFAADAFVYPACLLKQTIHLLQTRTEIRVPEDMQQLVMDGYSPDAAPETELESWMEMQIEEQLSAAKGETYTLNKPSKGYDPVNMSGTMILDDLEKDSYLSAKTRLGEPSARIALLTEELYKRVTEAEYVYKSLVQQVLKQSVSIRKKAVQAFLADEAIVAGAGLLNGVYLIPLTSGMYESENGKIINDKTLGVIIEKG